MKLTKIFAIILLLTVSFSCSKDKTEDTPASWEVISTNQGLLSNDTYCIFEASDNTIWVGSEKGVSHYDGTKWTNYTITEGSEHYGVRDIAEDANGNIIVATQWIYFGAVSADVYMFNGSGFEIAYDDEFPNANRIFMDSKGRQWFSFYSIGVGYMQNGELTMFKEQDGLVSNKVSSITEDKEGNIWIGTFYGLSKWTGTGFVNYTTENGLPIDRINDITVDISGNIWLAHYESTGGTTMYDGQNFTLHSEETGATDYVNSIYGASDGSVWAGTSDDAAYRYKNGAWKVYTKNFDISFTNYINDIKEIGNDLWFCVDGVGLVVCRNFKNEK